MKFFAGIDIGGTNIKTGIVDEAGNIISEDSVPTGAERPQEVVLQDIIYSVKESITKAKVAPSAVGMGSPGLIDSKNGFVLYNNNLNWNNFAIGPAMTEALDRKSVV